MLMNLKLALYIILASAAMATMARHVVAHCLANNITI